MKRSTQRKIAEFIGEVIGEVLVTGTFVLVVSHFYDIQVILTRIV